MSGSSCISTFASLLKGIGAFLVGIAAIIALYQTQGVLGEIFKIQEQALEIKTAIALLRSEIKEKDIAKYSNKIPENASREAIEEIISTIPSKPASKFSLSLPDEYREQMINRLEEAKTSSEKEAAFRSLLKWEDEN